MTVQCKLQYNGSVYVCNMYDNIYFYIYMAKKCIQRIVIQIKKKYM